MFPDADDAEAAEGGYCFLTLETLKGAVYFDAVDIERCFFDAEDAEGCCWCFDKEDYGRRFF